MARRVGRYAAAAALVGTASLAASTSGQADTPRARDLGVEFHGEPGPLNAITDVAGVEVGHRTLISGSGPRVVGTGPVRTGVTAVLPRGRKSTTPVFAAWSTLNAAGEMTGTVWLDERGMLDGPILITNTHSVGVARDASIGWSLDNGWSARWFAPLVAETFDGRLNDINGFHVATADVRAALDSARPGVVQEGAVGGGTGMICNLFKGGIGTSSRRVRHADKTYTVGVLVQCNYGEREQLSIAGVPVGQMWKDIYLPCTVAAAGNAEAPPCRPAGREKIEGRDGSIIVVIATDAPLLPVQLRRLSKRASLGLGRLGAIATAGSGDIFVAFSTANANLRSTQDQVVNVEMFPNESLSPLFGAAVDATEEAVVNSMVAAGDMTGADNLKIFGLPHAQLREIMAHRQRLFSDRR